MAETTNLGPYPIAGLVRRARRIGDLSQRQLANRAKVAPATVGRIEAGTLVPRLDVLQRLLGAAGLFLVVVDANGHVILPMEDRPDLRDGAERRYPSHLDTILDPRPGEWWADIYGLARPPSAATGPTGTGGDGAASGRSGWRSTGARSRRQTRAGSSRRRAGRRSGRRRPAPRGR